MASVGEVEPIQEDAPERGQAAQANSRDTASKAAEQGAWGSLVGRGDQAGAVFEAAYDLVKCKPLSQSRPDELQGCQCVIS
jgi:hypothetical protein